MQSEVQIYHPARDQKSIRVLKAVLRWGGRIVMMGLAVLVVAIAYLSHVGEPSSASSMKFEGFIELPKDRIVNIFDYMALSDRTIFVGNMLSGSVVKVQLTNDQGGPLATVSEQRGAGNAHGIAVDSARRQSICYPQRRERCRCVSAQLTQPVGTDSGRRRRGRNHLRSCQPHDLCSERNA